MALPYYPRYPRDFLDGTAAMSFELKGAYAILLDIIYAQDGACPDNDRYVSGLLGCSVRAWKNYKNELVRLGKICIENDIISNFRADKELVKSRLYQDKMRENGSKPKKNNNLEKPKLNQTETETETIKKDKKKVINFTKVFDVIFEISSFNIFYSKYPRKKNPNQAFRTFQKLNGKAKLSQILAKVEMHKAELVKNKTEERFIQHPSTWLNENNFDDLPTTQKPHTPQITEIEAAIARRDKGQPWRFEQFNMTEAQARQLVTNPKLQAIN